MVGDINLIGKETYVCVNDRGTLEKLPRIKWYWQLLLVIKNRIFGFNHLADIHNFISQHTFR